MLIKNYCVIKLTKVNMAHREKSSTYVMSVMAEKPTLSTIKPTLLETTLEKIFDTDVLLSDVKEKKRPKRLLPFFKTIRPFFKPKTGQTTKRLKATQVDALKIELIECCLTHMQDSYRIHLSRLRGLQILDTLIAMCPSNKLNQEMVTHMVWACLSCIHHFLLRLKSEKGIMEWIRRKQARRSIKTYDKLLLFLTSKFYTIVFNAIMTFFEEANLWEIEYLCSNLLRRILLIADRENRVSSLFEIITLIENSTLTNSMTSRQILHVLFDVEESQKWTWMNERMLDKLLDMYYCSITPEKSHEYNYESLDKSLEIFLRTAAINFPESHLMFMICWMLEVIASEYITDENLLVFGGLLEHVTGLYCKKAAFRPLPEEVLPAILKVISSKNLLYSILGHRVLHCLIDRMNNKVKLDTPIIFLRNSHYNIILNRYTHVDKLLFQRHREELHKTITESILVHGIHKIYLENVYISIALFLIEIPCAYTAAAGVCLAMALQEVILESTNVQMTHAHRVHATVVSLMSLVCYIHKAGVFYDYVESIIDRRSNFAPHLNPPLNMKYKYAQHHVLWNKPDLFFEDWEARYGLWRCFKNRKNVIVVQTGT